MLILSNITFEKWTATMMIRIRMVMGCVLRDFWPIPISAWRPRRILYYVPKVGASSTIFLSYTFTYDHREWKTGLPVRSAVLKPLAGWLVVGWVTTSESQLLYVFAVVRSVFLIVSLDYIVRRWQFFPVRSGVRLG